MNRNEIQKQKDEVHQAVIRFSALTTKEIASKTMLVRGVAYRRLKSLEKEGLVRCEIRTRFVKQSGNGSLFGGAGTRQVKEAHWFNTDKRFATGQHVYTSTLKAQREIAAKKEEKVQRCTKFDSEEAKKDFSERVERLKPLADKGFSFEYDIERSEWSVKLYGELKTVQGDFNTAISMAEQVAKKEEEKVYVSCQLGLYCFENERDMVHAFDPLEVKRMTRYDFIAALVKKSEENANAMLQSVISHDEDTDTHRCHCGRIREAARRRCDSCQAEYDERTKKPGSHLGVQCVAAECRADLVRCTCGGVRCPHCGCTCDDMKPLVTDIDAMRAALVAYGDGSIVDTYKAPSSVSRMFEARFEQHERKPLIDAWRSRLQAGEVCRECYATMCRCKSAKKHVVLRVEENKEWNEYIVTVTIDGSREEKDEYHTDDKEDARDTLREMALSYRSNGFVVVCK